MNERIKELALQAKEETDALYAKLTPQEFKDTYNQKFAELIVKEVMRMCGSASVSLLEHGYPTEASTMTTVKEFIADHFGVEE